MRTISALRDIMILYIPGRTGDDRTAPRTELSEMVQRGGEFTPTPWGKIADTGGYFYETWVYYSDP